MQVQYMRKFMRSSNPRVTTLTEFLSSEFKNSYSALALIAGHLCLLEEGFVFSRAWMSYYINDFSRIRLCVQLNRLQSVASRISQNFRGLLQVFPKVSEDFKWQVFIFKACSVLKYLWCRLSIVCPTMVFRSEKMWPVKLNGRTYSLSICWTT